MKGTLTVIKTSGEITSQDVTEKPTLETLQKSVGGLIEFIGSFSTYNGKPCIAICNEEGKLHKLPFNSKATLAWDEATGGTYADILVGDVLILTGDDEFLAAI